MPDIKYLRSTVNGVPVVAAPAEIDVTTADELRAVLLAATSRGHPEVVVDMTRTRFCDSCGLHTLLGAHKRIQANGGELRLVMPADGGVPRAVSLTCLDRLIPCFASLVEALQDIGYPVKVISGVPVVSAPAQVDAATADRLRMVLLEAATAGSAAVVLDLTGTLFCDSAGLGAVVWASKQILAGGGELRLVIPAGSAVFRTFNLTGLDKFIPRFGSLHEALLQRPADAIAPSGPRPVSPAGLSGSPDRGR